MSRLWTPLAITMSFAAIFAGGLVVSQEGGGSPEGTANLWVDVGAGSCTRSSSPVDYAGSASPDARCGSFDQAYDAANASASASTVLIASGTYGSQSITGSRASSNRITFDVAEGADVMLSATSTVTFGVGTEGSQPGEGPDYVTLKNIEMETWTQDGSTDNRSGIFVLPGSSFIRVEDAIIGGSYTASSHDIEWVGGSYGACHAPPMEEYDPDPTPDGYCPLNYVDHSTCEGFHADCQPPADVLFDGIEFHDYSYGVGGGCEEQGETGPDGCHHRTFYANGVNGLTIRNSTFRDGVFYPWTTLSGPEARAAGNQDILIENNQFGTNVTWNSGDYASSDTAGWENAWCQNANDQPGYRNVTIRFNSFARWAGANFPGWYSGESVCESENFKVYGNIFGSRPDCTTSGVVFRHNVYAGSVGGTCGTGDVNIGGSTMPFYTDDDRGPEFGDFALTGASAAPDNLVPADDATYPCPSTDANGTARPSGSGQFCDAGAFER